MGRSDDAELTRGQAAEAAQRIATLRGLLGDLGDGLDDAEVRAALWEQIRHEQAALAALLGMPLSPPAPA